MVKSNIVIIGMMGINKKEVGRELAEVLSINHCDTDELVEYEFASISYIIDMFGEAGYRKYERRAVNQVCSYENTVITTGEGVLSLDRNCELIASTATIIWLTSDLHSSFGNIPYKQKALLPRGDFNEYKTLYERFKDGYREYSDITVNVHLKSTHDIVKEILSKLTELFEV